MQNFAIYIVTLSMLLFIVVIMNLQKFEKIQLQKEESLPEIIDQIISGLQAGMSISETIASLAKNGPLITREDFKIFEINLKNGGNFQSGIEELKVNFRSAQADQLFETLIYSTKFGGRNIIKILHELSEFVASDQSLKAEITTRYGWVKNSAALAAIAPWLLFLILRTQENARTAYEQPIGQSLMIVGLITTLIAYFWMRRIAQLPRTTRIFQSHEESE